MANGDGYAGDVSPQEAWDILRREPKAVLVDVRTQPEWSFVGVPDLDSLGKRAILVPWQVYPDMRVHQGFAEDIAAAGVAREDPILFLCRSGARSRNAAMALTGLGYKTCYNVSEGFEGNHDAHGHRGTTGGWKAAKLPWKQS